MKEEVHYGQYLVCLMDLMGQKEMYKTLEGFPYPRGDKEVEFRNKLIQFVQMIEYFKRDVDTFMNGSNYKSNIEWPDEAKDLISKTNKSTCKIQRFSDGIMVFMPLSESGESLPISSMFQALLCTASTMLMSLAKENPVRIGIAIGGAVEIDEGELFGPAIGHAHKMESERAIYPRIAVHENVIEYLREYEHFKGSGAFELEKNYAYEMSQLCKSMITLDQDGEFILDYLGNAVWERSFRGGDEELLRLAYEFVKKERARFTENGNEKLMKKYRYLYNYFINSRHEIFKSPNKSN